MEAIGVIDYRRAEDIPDKCPYCGAEVKSEEGRGMVYVIGPADLKWAAEYGITEEGRYDTLWISWECVKEPGLHYGPVAYGIPCPPGLASR